MEMRVTEGVILPTEVDASECIFVGGTFVFEFCEVVVSIGNVVHK